MILVLFASFITIFLNYLDSSGKYVEVLIKSVVTWCGLLLLQVEIMSCFGLVNTLSVLLFWICVCMLICSIRIKRKKWVFKCKEFLTYVKTVMGHNKFLVGVFGGILILSVFTVPYNWDSMTYHISRIAHWVQNQSVAHYGTGILRQISSPPLHEFVGLHVYILLGDSDVFLNMIQYGAFVINAIIIYAISSKLGCKSKFCRLAVLLFCSMPIAFAEAITTQNDQFAGMWMLIYVYYIMDFMHIEKKIDFTKETVIKCFIMAACVGYGYLSKPSVCIGMLFFAVILLFTCIFRRDSFCTISKLICLSLFIITIIILPEVIRNISTFGAVLHSGTGSRQLVGTMNPFYLFINGIKNFTFNLPTIFIPQSSQFLKLAVCKIATLLNVDINAVSISEDGKIFSVGAPDTYGHDRAVNSIVLIVTVICFLWCLHRRRQENYYQRQYTYIVFALFIVFCTVVRWEPFVSRYMLPYLALLCIMASVQLQDISQNAKMEMWRISCVPVVCCLCIVQLSLLFSYHIDILLEQEVKRPTGYFRSRRNIEISYTEACEYISLNGYEEIGLILGGDSYEYPIFYMLKNKVKRIEHILVTNESCKYEDMLYEPDCVLTTNISEDTIEIHNNSYEKVMDGEEIKVYIKKK